MILDSLLLIAMKLASDSTARRRGPRSAIKRFPKSTLSFAGILAAMLLLMASCSKDHSATVLELLGGVPAEAEFVGVVNLSQCVEQTGGKVKDGKVVDAGNLLEVIEKHSGKSTAEAKWIFSENSGIDFSSAIFFTSGGKMLATLRLSDVDAFRGGYDKYHPGEWSNGEEGLLVKSDAIIKGDILWIGENLNPAQIAGFSELSEVESFRSDKYAETLSKSSDALCFISRIDGLLNMANVGFSQRASIKMGLGMFFNNPTFISGNCNLSGKELTSGCEILDNNLKPSKCELKVSEIDTEQVAALGGNANFIMALAVSQKLVKQLTDLASSVGGALPPAYSNVLSPLDGTIAVASDATSASKDNIPGYRASIATNGKDNAVLAQMLQNFGTLKIDNQLFNISSGSYGNGELPLSEVAESFKGAFIGAAIAPERRDESIQSVTFTIVPSSGSIKANLSVKFK